MENEKTIGKYFIIKNLKFQDFMKDENGEILLYDTFEDAMITCGMYEFENILVCKVKYNYKDEWVDSFSNVD